MPHVSNMSNELCLQAVRCTPPLQVLIAVCWICGAAWALAGERTQPSVAAQRLQEYQGNRDCVRLENKTTRVTLGSQGGRVLEYSFHGVDAMYLPKDGKGMNAGRFDIGPEQTIPKHPELWSGPWGIEIMGQRTARLTSVKDKPTGVQLTRDFQLDAEGSTLACKQTIHNVSEQTLEYCHWSRTFAHGGGIVVVPTSKSSRFPSHYVMYTPAPLINFRPQDDNVVVEKDHIQILAAPKHPKLGFDSQAGWLACLMKNDLLFIKRFPVYPDRVYNEVAGLTLSVWYPDGPMCELEPIGPRERIAPGESASFTETWQLLKHRFPSNRKADFEAIRKLAAKPLPPSPCRQAVAQPTEMLEPNDRKTSSKVLNIHGLLEYSRTTSQLSHTMAGRKDLPCCFTN